MRRGRTATVIAGLSLLTQIVMGAHTRAAGPEPTVEVSAGLTGLVATIIGLPVKAATCVATIALGGTGYGLTAGQSEFVRDELIKGIPYVCGTELRTTPPEVGRIATEPAWSR